MELPVPKNWQEFETIVRDAQAQRWKSTSLQKAVANSFAKSVATS